MIFVIVVIALIIIVSQLAAFVWFALRNARAESVWQAIEDEKESVVQPNVAPPDKPKANSAHA